MKTRSKKPAFVSILTLTLVILLSAIAHARPFTDAFKGGLTEISGFFESGYAPYTKAIDFFFFSLLFIAIYLMGVRYAFKDVKRPEQAIAILLGFMTAFLLVLGGFSVTILLPYIHWVLYALLFVLYGWLLKGIKSRLWRFVLALLLTLLTIGLVQGLFGTLAAPDTQGFFSSFGGAFRDIELPGVSAPGVPDYLKGMFEPKAVPTPKEAETVAPVATPPEALKEKGFFGRNLGWLIPLIVLAIAASGYAGYRKRDTIKGLFKRGEKATARQPEAEATIEQTLREIDDYLGKKKDALINVYNIYKTKRKLTQELIDFYYKTISVGEPVSLLDPEDPKHKEFLKNRDFASNLIRQEEALGSQLGELLKNESRLIGADIEKWRQSVKKIFLRQPLTYQKEKYQKGFDELVSYLAALNKSSNEARITVQKYFLITKVHIKSEEELRGLLDQKELEKWIKAGGINKWRSYIQSELAKSKDFAGISKELNKEEIDFLKKELFPAINLERLHLRHISWLIRYLQSNAEIKTVIQELTAHPAEATQKPGEFGGGVEVATPLTISTKVIQGMPPFRAYCFVYKKEKEAFMQVYPRAKKPIMHIATGKELQEEYKGQLAQYEKDVEATSKMINNILGDVAFTSKDFGDLEAGEYRVEFFVRGSSEIKQYNWDRKDINIFIKKTIAPPAPEEKIPKEKVGSPQIVITEPREGSQVSRKGTLKIKAEIKNYELPKGMSYKLILFRKFPTKSPMLVSILYINTKNIKFKVEALKFRIGTGECAIYVRVVNIFPGTSKPHLDSNVVTINIK